jgi:hypothetical protein
MNSSMQGRISPPVQIETLSDEKAASIVGGGHANLNPLLVSFAINFSEFILHGQLPRFPSRGLKAFLKLKFNEIAYGP